jgi:amino acid permease
MFSLAYASSQLGFVLTVAFLPVLLSLTFLSLHVLSVLALEFKALWPTRRLSFASLSHTILPRFIWVLDVSTMIFCVGAIISYLTNVGTLLAEAFHNISPWNLSSFSLRNSSLVIRAVLLVLLAPLLLSKRLESSQYASLFGLFCIFYILILILIYSPFTAARTDIATLVKPVGTLQALSVLPLVIFAYTCQHNVFHIFNELRDVQKQKLNQIYLGGLGTCTAVYLISVLPYFTFGTDVKHNFLLNLRKPDGSVEAPVTVALIFSSFSLSMTYVLLLLPVRMSIMALAFGDQQPYGSREVRWRACIVLCIVLATFGVSAALSDNVALPIEIAGLLGGNTLGFVFPFILYLKRYGFRKGKRSLSLVVCGALLFCILLYPISLVGMLHPGNF